MIAQLHCAWLDALWRHPDQPAQTGNDEINVNWGSYERWDYDEKDVYKVLVKSKHDEFVEVKCENEKDGLINEVSKTGLCKFNVAKLMSEPFELYYGDFVSARIYVRTKLGV